VCVYGCAYALVSKPHHLLPPLAETKCPFCRHFQFLAARCRSSVRTLIPRSQVRDLAGPFTAKGSSRSAPLSQAELA
jgi:hypothetical protein